MSVCSVGSGGHAAFPTPNASPAAAPPVVASPSLPPLSSTALLDVYA